MKRVSRLALFLASLLLVVASSLCFVRVDGIGVKWTVTIAGGARMTAHLLDPATVPQSRAEELILLATRSLCTSDPVSQDCSSLVHVADALIVTNRYILWLDQTPDLLTQTSGGAGLLRGLWSIACCDGVGNWNFVHIENDRNWAPNEVLPGALGNNNGGSGASLQLRVESNQDIPGPLSIGAENTDECQRVLDGAPIQDGGLYSGVGVFYQFEGLLAHFERDPDVLAKYGFDSAYDVNATLGVTSTLHFVLTYRIAPNEPILRQEMTLQVQGADTSPIASFVMSTCALAGVPGSPNASAAAVPRIRNHGTSPPQCSAAPEYPAGAWVAFDPSTIARRGLEYFENAADFVLADGWNAVSAGAGRRSLLVRAVGPEAGFSPPEHVQELLNGYSSPGTGVVCVDAQYTDANQCGPNAPWRQGSVSATAVDLSFVLDKWPPSGAQ